MGYFFHQEPVNYLNSINGGNFDSIALELFRHQYAHNIVYRDFTDALNISPGDVQDITAIPFLPVSFFKTHDVIIGDIPPAATVFRSSTTTSEVPARHIVKDIGLYDANLFTGFRQFYGESSEYVFLALLPSYLQREGASLVYMVQRLMDSSGREMNGFYLDEHEQLYNALNKLEAAGQKYILVGVTFGLLDFAERYSMALHNGIVMETGGMKGRRREMTRVEVHDILKNRLGVSHVHSEYGMTELLSQAYAERDGLFYPSPTLKVLVR
ncbi:MAG TPA: acyl transferase, partial [Flavipsychrobacter sp.]